MFLICFATMAEGFAAIMCRSEIDEFLRILDDVVRQMGEPGGWDQAVRRIQSRNADPRPENVLAVRIGFVVTEYLFRVLYGGSLIDTVDIDNLPTRSDLEHALAAAPEFTDEDLEQLKRVPFTIRRSFEDVARTIEPKGGHPVIVPRSKYPMNIR